MANITPPINATGVYTLKAPWATVPDTVYTCIAVRYYKDLILQGVDIAAQYYLPMGLTADDYTTDLNNGAKLITLTAAGEPTIYVPDSYIAAYPDLSSVGYNRCPMG
jgi:hypothetical protein